MNYEIKRPPLSENFQLPSREDLLKLKQGNLVKVMFQVGSDPVERMWIRITGQPDIAEWLGEIDNDPFGEEAEEVLKAGTKVKFHPYDVIQIWDEKQQ